MIPDKKVFDARRLDPRDRYKLLTGLVVPRPIGWIGTRSAAGVDNLAPYSFFNLVVGTPPTVLFSPGRFSRVKDTLANAIETGVFTVNIVTEEVAEAMNVTSGEYAAGTDEFEVAGLAKTEGVAVAAPLVAAARANFECEVSYIHDIGPGPNASVVFGEVLRIHVDQALLDGTRIDLAMLKAVGRLAGPWYSTTTDQFAMKRP